MKKKTKSTAVTKVDAMAALIEQVRSLVQSARHAAAAAVNTLQVRTNFEIGRLIVEHEQQGQDKAKYGELVIKTLSEKLQAEFGRGFSKRNLEFMRQFYIVFGSRFSQIAQTPPAQLQPIAQTPSAQSLPVPKSQTVSDESSPISETPSRKFT